MVSPTLKSAWWRVVPKGKARGRVHAALLFFLSAGLSTSFPWAAGQSPITREQPIPEYEDALGKVRQGDCRGALDLLQSLTVKVPRFYRAFNLMGECYDR